MIRKLLRSVREYKWPAILTPLTMAGEVAMECLIPMLMADLIDKGINAGNMAFIWRMGGMLVLCALASLAFGVTSGHFAAVAGAGFAHNLRNDLYDRVQTFSFANIDRFSTGGLITRITTDVTNVQMAFQMCIRMAIRAPFMFLFSIVMSIRLGGRLSLAFVVFLPLLAFGLIWVATHAHPYFKAMFKKYDHLNTVVGENLRGIRVVKSFVREDAENAKFLTTAEDMRQNSVKAEKILALNSPLMCFCLYGAMLLISWFGAKAVVASGNNPAAGLSSGELTGLFTYGMQILSSLMMLSMVFVMIVLSRASMERVTEVLDEESAIFSPENAVTSVEDGSIEMKNVTFRYNRDSAAPVLDNVNLRIESGWTVGILGGTGSSKSSLVQLIPRLYDANEGTVLVGGRDVREYDLTALRDAVAFVLQKNELFSGTIRENLRWGNENATDEEMVRACELAQADGFIRSFPDGYDTRIEQGGTNVSGGQKQRLCIARALLKNPKILILDDSTSAVDTATDAKIREGFRSYIPEVTKLIIAQRVASVQDADRIIVMDGGRVAAFGTHDELMKTSGIYREVYETQTSGADAKGGDAE